MKRIMLVLLTLILLYGCQSEIKELPVNDNVTLSVELKDNKEYIMVDQYTDIDSIDFERYLDIKSNKDLSYNIKWVGQGFAYTYDKYEDILGIKVVTELRIGENSINDVETEVDEEFINKDKQTTLNSDGFVSISIYVQGEYEGRKIEKRLDTLLFVYPEDFDEELKNVLVNKNTIEDVYKTLCTYAIDNYKNNPEKCKTYKTALDIWNEKGYVSNIRFKCNDEGYIY